MKIAHRLAIGFLVPSVLIAAGGFVGIAISRNTLLGVISHYASNFAEETLEEVNREFFVRIEELQAFAETLVLGQAAKRSSDEFNADPDRDQAIQAIDRDWKEGRDSPFIRQLLDNELSRQFRERVEFYRQRYRYPLFAELYATNAYGVVIGASERTSDYLQADEAWYRQAIAEQDFWMGDPEFDASSGVFSVDLVILLRDERGAFAGILKGVLNLEAIWQTMADVHGPLSYHNAQSLLVDRKGFLIFAGSGPLSGREGRDVTLREYGKDLSADEDVARAIHGGRGVSISERYLTAFTHAGGFRDFPGVGWSVLLRFDKTKALRPVLELGRVVLILAGLFVLVMAGQGLWTTASLVKPVKQLEAAVGEISRGNLDAAVVVRSRDELGMLASSFNRMAQALRQSRERETQLAAAKAAAAIEQVKSAELTTMHGKMQQEIEQRKQAQNALLNLLADLKASHGQLQAAQAQLIQAAKMESVGQLASGIAHDFNNYLSVIHGFAELIQMRSKDDPKLFNQLGEILHAAESGTALVQQLMAFSRQRTVEPKVFSLTEAVARIAQLLQRLVGAGVQITLDLPPTSLMVRMDPTVLEQILMNLASNARDAMQKQGTITIRAGRVVVDEAFRSARPGMKAGDFVRLSFQDSGPGMEPAVAARVFEPFFTTKKLGQGTGLGLAVVYGLIKQYDGYVDLETAPGRGAAFHVYLPHQVKAADEGAVPAASPETAKTPAAPWGARRARILVVDDEPGSRQLCGQILQEAYEVLTVSSGAEALDALGRGSVDMLLTDIQMPEMDGVTLLEKALERHPGLKVAVMSAFMTKEREQQLRALSSACEMIRKPLTVSGLTEAVGRCLAA